MKSLETRGKKNNLKWNFGVNLGLIPSIMRATQEMNTMNKHLFPTQGTDNGAVKRVAIHYHDLHRK